jgi:aryl-alcohol dehydrogenase-like predicted oxidoreductase
MKKNAVPTRTIGKTDIAVTPIGLGTWQFAGGHKGISGWYWPEIPYERAESIVRSALQSGLNWFDTAEVYGNGRSERTLARALKACRVKNGDVIIVDKWWPLLRTARSIKTTISARLRALDGFAIDLYLVHQPSSLSSVTAQMNAMADLVEAGKIRAVGISNFGRIRMRYAHKILKSRGIPLAANQVKYNLLDRTIETNGLLETAKELGISIIAWSPLEQGLLTGIYHEDPSRLKRLGWFRKQMFGFTGAKLKKTRPLIDALKRIALAHNATPSQAALSWLTNFHGDAVITIAGASKPAQIEDNAEAMTLRLTSLEMEELDRLSRQWI